MSLTGQNFKDIAEKFEEYNGKFNSVTNIPEAAKIIATHRNNLYFLFANNIIEGKTDETELQQLKTALEAKKKEAENQLGEYAADGFDFSTNRDIETFRTDIVNGSGSHLYTATSRETKNTTGIPGLKNLINEIFEGLKYLKVDYNNIQDTGEHLFKENVNENSGNTTSTSPTPLLQKLYNEGTASNVGNDIQDLLKKEKDNELYINKIKLEKNNSDITIRIALYCYAILRVCNKNILSDNLKNKAETILNKIKDDFLPKLKLIYNAYQQLKYVSKGYELIQKVDKCEYTQTEGEYDLKTGKKEINLNLNSVFKEKTDSDVTKQLDFTEYNIETAKIEITDGTGATYPVNIKPTGSVPIRNIEIKNKLINKQTIQIEIYGKKIDIGEIELNGTSKTAKITFFDEANLQSQASTARVSIPFDKLQYSIPLQGVVYQGAVPQLMVAATRTITGTLTGITATATAPLPPTPPTSGGTTPPPPPPTPAASNELTAVITDTDYLAEKKARLQKRNGCRILRGC